LLCPRCDYRLAGLVEARCPECGLAFDWSDPGLTLARRVKIRFERSRGFGRLGGFVVTWFTVLVAPWIFARQAVARAGLPAATGFALLCTALACGILLVDPDPWMYAAWMLTALAHITVQAWALAHLDRLMHGQERSGDVRWWLAVGLYSWAFFFVHLPTGGPPVVLFTDGLHAAFGAALPLGAYKFDAPYAWSSGVLATWVQFAWWLAVMGVIWAVAAWHRRRSVTHLLVSTPLAIALAAVVYTGVLESIGAQLVMWLAA
jgi:hypothetical protein